MDHTTNRVKSRPKSQTSIRMLEQPKSAAPVAMIAIVVVVTTVVATKLLATMTARSGPGPAKIQRILCK
jgi:hypothetical protein